VIFCAQDAHAGAWLQPEGASYVKLTLLGQNADQRWNCRGGDEPADPAGDYESLQVFGYGEYGLLDWMTLTGSWAYKNQSIEGSSEYGTKSTGDLRLGCRMPILRERWPVSVEAIASFPTYERSDLNDPPALREQYLPAGSGRFESELWLLAGRSLWPLPLYLNGQTGLRSRGGPFEDQWLAVLEMGGSSPYFFAKAELRWTIPLEEECGVGDGAAGTVALQERSVVLSPELALRIRGDFWLNLSYAQAVSGRNTLQGGVWGLGLLYWAPGSS